MLQEVTNVRQLKADFFRRFFSDEDLDLYIWHKPDRSFYGFQLCYDLTEKAKAFTWTEDRGFTHHGIDTGDTSPLENRSPVLVPNSRFDAARVFAHFRAVDDNLPVPIRDFVLEKIEAYELNQPPLAG